MAFSIARCFTYSFYGFLAIIVFPLLSTQASSSGLSFLTQNLHAIDHGPSRRPDVPYHQLYSEQTRSIFEDPSFWNMRFRNHSDVHGFLFLSMLQYSPAASTMGVHYRAMAENDLFLRPKESVQLPAITGYVRISVFGFRSGGSLYFEIQLADGSRERLHICNLDFDGWKTFFVLTEGLNQRSYHPFAADFTNNAPSTNSGLEIIGIQYRPVHRNNISRFYLADFRFYQRPIHLH